MSIIEKAMGRRGNPQSSERLSPNITRKVVRHPAGASDLKDDVLTPQAPTPLETLVHEKSAHQLPPVHLQADTIISYNATPETVEEYRRIKRPLLANAFGKGELQVERGNLIMITSALPDEGKTAVSFNLAVSIALERNYTVLAVDADIAKREISRLYGLDNSLGLTDILLDDDLNLHDLLIPTDFPSLSILPAGHRHAHAMELLASNKMDTIMAELVDRYPNQVIIMDCPPILATNEPQVLVRLVGQIVMVVEAGKTPQRVVQDAIAALDTSKAINLVLNKSRHSGGYDGYGKYRYGSE